MSTSSTKRKAGDTQVIIGNDEEVKTHKQEQDRQILENAMSINSRKRTAETKFVNKHEANQTRMEKEGEGGCQTMGSCCNPELPAHIVIDILSRLPMKSLFNFRRVCKEWLSLISDPHFANLHLSKSQLSLLLKPLDCKRRSWKLNLVDLKTTPLIRPRNARKEFVTKINLPKGPSIPCNIVNSCNGLLCLSGDSNSNSGPCSDDLICICNPLLGELVTLPKCPSVRPISDLSCVAFGYSPMTDQYKVVRSFRSRVTDPVMDRETCEAEIYTLGEGSWRSIGKIPTIVHSHSFNAFLNGSLHWLSHALSEDFIYCFDFGSEQFRAVPEPFEFGPVHRECSGYMYLGVLQGCLSICDFGGGCVAEVWVMKDYGVKESWSKNFVIEDCRVCYYEPILILEGGQILIFEHNMYSIVLYDPRSNCLRNIHTFGNSGTCFFGLAHVPSLLSLMNVAKGENFKKFNSLKETGSSSKKDG